MGSRQSRYERIADIMTLFNEASDLHARLLRMAPKADGGTVANTNALAALATAARKLGVVSPFKYSARGVVFLQRQEEILGGARPLKHIEAESAAGYIAREARKACGL